MTALFDTGEYFVSKDNLNFPRNSQFPIVALKGNEKQIKDIINKIKETDLSWIAYIQEMIDLADDKELVETLNYHMAEDLPFSYINHHPY